MTAIPSPTPAPPPAPLGRFLLHPGPATARLLHHLVHVVGHVALLAGLPTLAVVLAAAAVVVVARRRQTARMQSGARLVHVLSPPEIDPAGATALWTNLVALLRPAWARALTGQPHLSFELTASFVGLDIGLWVPGGIPPGLVERAVEAAWPGARTTTTPATPPLPVDGAAATGGVLRLTDADCYPIRTDHRSDPARALLGALSALEETESACVQVLGRPVTGRRLAALHRAAAARRAGRPASRVAGLLDLLTPGTSGRRPVEVDPSRAGDVAAILAKAAQPCWAVQVRYGLATTATDPAAAAQLRGRAHAVASAFALFAARNRFDRHRLRHPTRALAGRRLGRGDLLSVTELAAVAHLPTDTTVPGLARAGAKAVAPPPDLPADGKILGDAQAGVRRPVALAVPDAAYHLHVLGATGSGKSTLLTNLILGDITAGRGVVVIDPKGDLVTDVLDRLPPGADERLALIDPEETSAPPVLNVLAGPEPDLAVDNLVGIFRSIFAAFWGPRTDDVLRAACLTLLRHAAATGTTTSLAEVPRLLSDPAWRAPRVAAVRSDTVGLGGFWAWYEHQSPGQQAQVVGPVLNKLRAFLLRDFARALVGRTESTIDLGAVLDGGICLVRVPKGLLGEDTARLLGSFVVAQVWQAATHRARHGQTLRRDAALYVDECQNFLTLPRSFDEMLAEARGYRLSMVLAHQHLAQLPRDLREAISANARSKMFFACSPEDANSLARHVAPELSEHDLSHLGVYTAAARLVAAGQQTPAFTLTTRPAPAPAPGRPDAARAAARARYGRPLNTGGERAPELGVLPEAMRSERAGRSAGDAPRVASGVVPPAVPPGVLSCDPLPHAEGAGRRRAGGSSQPADSWQGVDPQC